MTEYIHPASDSFLTFDPSRVPSPCFVVDEAAVEILMGSHWPGNVRELKNAVDTAAINCETQMIRLEDLPQEMLNAPRIQPAVENFGEDTKSQLETALHQAGGNRSKAAKLLGVSRATFYRRLIDAGIETIKRPKS